jgi:ABC-type polysaccharide/polyol phosphate transport system ATPase subunit
MSVAVAPVVKAGEAGVAEVRTEEMGVRFDFDRRARVLTPNLAAFRRVRATNWGLKHLNLSFDPGSAVALVGPTGSGKTTLLRVLAGAMEPDEGTVHVRGRIGSLLATGAGLGGLLTGRENTELLGVLAGLSLAETRAGEELVKERSKLEEAYDRPVHTYSQGMRARLGFAVIQAISPGVLLLDEVFEALDHEFRALVEEYARGLRDQGGIVVAAGHDHAALERLCSRALWLHRGEVQADGPLSEVIAAYRRA